jgi:hypothetical protein
MQLQQRIAMVVATENLNNNYAKKMLMMETSKGKNKKWR